MSDLRESFELWLSEHLTPAKTMDGTVRRSRGVIVYQDMDTIQLLLGASILPQAERFRAGDDVAYPVKLAIQELVDAWDIPAIQTLRRDQAVAQDLRHGIRFQSRFGTAPDGGDLKEWSLTILRRANLVFDIDGTPDLAIWRELHPPTLNSIRRRRRAA